MKYVGYLLFSLIFISLFFSKSASEFFTDSYELAPEITFLVSFCYVYIVLLTIVLSIFPKLTNQRLSLYNHHIKMTCSVMVSLGLVGTFLGLVEMISGIGAALSGEETDFAKRMEALLGAISTSLGAMSFAFMTSILGVGISAYSLVAATFVASSFSEEDKKQRDNKTTVKKDDDYTSVVNPILERMQTIEEERILENKRLSETNQILDDKRILLEKNMLQENNLKIEASTTLNNALSKRMQELEDKFSNIDIERFEKQFTPLLVMDSITQHHQLLEKHNELLTSSILQLNRNHLTLVQSLDSLSLNLNEKSTIFGEQYKSISVLNETLLKSNDNLLILEQSAQDIKHTTSTIFEKIKKIFS